MVSGVLVAADKRAVDEARIGDLTEQLKALEAAAALLSAERRRLHDRIDAGFGAAFSSGA